MELFKSYVLMDMEAMEKSLVTASNAMAINLYGALAEEGGNIFLSLKATSDAMFRLLNKRGHIPITRGCVLELQLINAIGHPFGRGHVKKAFEETLHTLESQDTCDISEITTKFRWRDMSERELVVSDVMNVQGAAMQEYLSNMMAVLRVRSAVSGIEKRTVKIIKRFEDVNERLVSALSHPRWPDSAASHLAAAVFFRAAWQRGFDKQKTFARTFYNKGQAAGSKKVPMMHMEDGSFPLAETSAFKALQLPFVRGEVAMLVLLPRSRDGLGALESSLTPALLEELDVAMTRERVKVALPKFRLEFDKSLVPAIRRLGVDKIHLPEDHRQGMDGTVCDVQHRAVLEVTEEGSGVPDGMSGYETWPFFYDPVQEFVADHPFCFFIVHVVNRMVLYMGRVEEL